MKRVWDIRDVDKVQAESLAQSLQISPLLSELLLARGVADEEAGRRFLSPALQDLHDPFLMTDMDRVVARIVEALRSGDKVCVWGDYDVDGITATSVLLLFLREVGLDVIYHIPSRLEEGYGLNTGAIDRLAEQGIRLLVTVDCGISDVEPIRHAVGRGLDVVVLDHHQVPEELPAAQAILNPHRADCAFPAKDLAAVGVAFNLVMALRAELRKRGSFQDKEPNLRELLDLVALGTVADIVPLIGENRIITRFGLEELSAGRRPGVAALKEVAGLHSGPVTSGQVAFRLAPRINAAGRLGSAGQGVELMTTRSYSTALQLARELDQANSQRQGIEQTIYTQALEQAEQMMAGRRQEALVLASDEWHVGVVGIVASRLTDRFGCPVVLVSLDGERGRGSARGVEGAHLYEALLQCAGHLQAYGGHRLAAGLTIERKSLDAFRKDFCGAIARQLAGTEARKTIQVDAVVQPSRLDAKTVQSLADLAPHGLGNPEPVFAALNLEIRGLRTVGREPPYHLKAVAVEDGRSWDVIGFRMAERIPEFGPRMDLVYTPEFNTWDGQTSIQLRLIDARPAQRA
jgi:single-stranded-DNA-specific exonuclease